MSEATLPSSSAVEADEEGGPRTLVLVGVTGDGKSSTGNTLCGRPEFTVDGGLGSVTAEASSADYLDISPHGVNEVRVVDTIGLHDTNLPVDEVMRRFSSFADLTPMGIDVFLFVVRFGRFRPDHEAAVDAFVANAGEAALQHTVLVFTACKQGPSELSAQLETHAPPALRRLLAKLPTPPIGIDNGSDDARARLHAVVQEVCEANRGRRYSNTALAEARARHDTAREAERAAFAAAVADWRKGSGPVLVEREC